MFEYVTVYGVIKFNREIEKHDVVKIKLEVGIYKIDVYFYVATVKEHNQKLYLELEDYQIAEGDVV